MIKMFCGVSPPLAKKGILKVIAEAQANTEDLIAYFFSPDNSGLARLVPEEFTVDIQSITVCYWFVGDEA